jgi:hypothetical protein
LGPSARYSLNVRMSIAKCQGVAKGVSERRCIKQSTSIGLHTFGQMAVEAERLARIRCMLWLGPPYLYLKVTEIARHECVADL